VESPIPPLIRTFSSTGKKFFTKEVFKKEPHFCRGYKE